MFIVNYLLPDKSREQEMGKYAKLEHAKDRVNRASLMVPGTYLIRTHTGKVVVQVVTGRPC